MIRTALAILLLGVPAASPSAAAGGPAAGKPAATSAHGKSQAPVTVDAALGAGTARVTVRFDRAVTDAAVAVHGLDGLVVTSDATPLSGARFAAGQKMTFDVGFTPGPGRGYLVVSVGGQFGGSRRSAVSTFAVGMPSSEQLKPAGTPAADAEGHPVKVMPSGK